MRITVLTYIESEKARKRDPVVDQVLAALLAAGHDADVLGVHGDVHKLIGGLEEKRPELVFNLMEMFGDDFQGAIPVVGLLDLIKVPYTGGGPGEFYLQEDKAITKKLLHFEGLDYPDFAVFSKDADLETGGNLRMPLFVKPLRGEASVGITGKALVSDAKQMMARVIDIHEKLRDSALVEEYIDGREFYVGVLGNQSPRALAPIEMDFSGLPPGKPKILDSKAKWSKNSVEYKGTRAVVAELPDELRAKLQNVALNAYRALRVRDYGRIDLRLAEDGRVYVIEVNASCYLEQDSEFALAARADGIEYGELVQRIVELACERRGLAKAAKA
jgi:D-alanine-D-alanine ligase